jgi:hypothetical protein
MVMGLARLEHRDKVTLVVTLLGMAVLEVVVVPVALGKLGPVQIKEVTAALDLHPL